MSSSHLDRGLWMVLASPFDDDLALDTASLEHQLVLADSVSAQGVVALGVFGEADALTRAEQQEVVRTVTAASDLPVVLGLSSRTTAVAVDPYELWRGVFSRRSRDQVRAWDWTGDPGPWVERIGVFGPRDDDQPLPAHS